ncbi:MAG: bifunctional demethylmenaquinone methyltransferase/2-methoxy-6-polyprenyl-1,4-benzoquinol methylase UbiE [Chlamydiia bacterium]|nr:bifunctional demethylmenaquinone methyltransferase/2-methoxy-6-polyprenyl-1,4-benzoquinol methylase UbiE [Chlamydiia bacterium]
MTDTYQKQAPETIQAMFGSIASNYDKGNAILSFNLHRLWNRCLVHEVRSGAEEGDLLDLCSGTGDIAIQFLRQAPADCHGYLLDFCPEMLQEARTKTRAAGLLQPTTHLHFIHGDAQDIALEDNSVQFITMAYGIRNIKDPAQACREALRVLKPGGRFGILELTRPSNPLLRQGHGIYLKLFLPLLGRLVTSNRNAYKYLCQSIENFIAPDELREILADSGFAPTWQRPLMGGIATILVGTKPH